MTELAHALNLTTYGALQLRAFKVGGIRFLRIGRFQFSFCVCRHPRR